MGCSRGCSRTFRLYDAVLTRLPRPPRAAYYILALVIAVLAALLFIYHKQITTWLRPAADWMKECVLCFVWTWGGGVPTDNNSLPSLPPSGLPFFDDPKPTGRLSHTRGRDDDPVIPSTLRSRGQFDLGSSYPV
jgi:hypothetical protein